MSEKKFNLNKLVVAAGVFFGVVLALLGLWTLNCISNISTDAAQVSSNLNVISTLLFFFAVCCLITGFSLANFFEKKIGTISRKLGVGAENLEKASMSLSDTGAGLAATTHEQSIALQQTASSLVELETMVSKNAQNSAKSQELAVEGITGAEKGQAAVQEMIVSINNINKSQDEILLEVENSNKKITEIVGVIGEIGNKTKVINDIVFQTKLLSFNASVEAARAGEHGKGFAVVAQEIGNLAKMSGQAAQEITLLLEESINKVQNIISATTGNVSELIKNGRQKVNLGTSLAKKCEDALSYLTANIQSLGQLIKDITDASKEQATGIAEINKAVQQLEISTQTTTNASQMSSAESHKLLEEATDLKQAIHELHLFYEYNEESRQSSGAPVTQKSKRTLQRTLAQDEKSKVIPIASARVTAKAKKQEPTTAAAHAQAKRVVGTNIPLESDPRFEDV